MEHAEIIEAWLKPTDHPASNVLSGLDYESLQHIFPGLCTWINSKRDLLLNPMELRVIGVIQFLQRVNKDDIWLTATDWYSFLAREWLRPTGYGSSAGTVLVFAVQMLAELMRMSDTSIDIVCKFALPDNYPIFTQDETQKAHYVLAWLFAFREDEDKYTKLAMTLGVPRAARCVWTPERILEHSYELTLDWVKRAIRYQQKMQEKWKAQLSAPRLPIPLNYVVDRDMNWCLICPVPVCEKREFWWRQFRQHMEDWHGGIGENGGWIECQLCQLPYTLTTAINLEREEIDHRCNCMEYRSPIINYARMGNFYRAFTTPLAYIDYYDQMWQVLTQGNVRNNVKYRIAVTIQEPQGTATLVRDVHPYGP